MSISTLIAEAGKTGGVILRSADIIYFAKPLDPTVQASALVDFGDGESVELPTLTTNLTAGAVCAVIVDGHGTALIIGQYGEDPGEGVGYLTSLPTGGTEGQVLVKRTNADGDAWWVTPPVGPQGPAGQDGEDGADGLDGATGPQGPAGVTTIPGGLVGQALVKYGDGDGEVWWVYPTPGPDAVASSMFSRPDTDLYVKLVTEVFG